MRELKPSSGELLQGTLDMLILKTLIRGPMHGYGVVEFIQQTSEDVLRVEEGALYPALHRLELRGLLTAEWGVSGRRRRAGRGCRWRSRGSWRQLRVETDEGVGIRGLGLDAETRRRGGRGGEEARAREGSGFRRSPGGGASGERGGKKSELRSDGQGRALSHCSRGRCERFMVAGADGLPAAAVAERPGG